jgi:hypothetical protein
LEDGADSMIFSAPPAVSMILSVRSSLPLSLSTSPLPLLSSLQLLSLLMILSAGGAESIILLTDCIDSMMLSACAESMLLSAPPWMLVSPLKRLEGLRWGLHQPPSSLFSAGAFS